MAGITNHTGSKSLVNHVDQEIIRQEKKLKIKNPEPKTRHQHVLERTTSGGIRMITL